MHRVHGRTGFKQNQQGLCRRNKKRFAAQAMLLWLEALAHNVLIWARGWLAPTAHVVSGYGLARKCRNRVLDPERSVSENTKLTPCSDTLGASFRRPDSVYSIPTLAVSHAFLDFNFLLKCLTSSSNSC